MIIDRSDLVEYPFTGEFYGSYVDESKPLDEQTEELKLVLRTVCDIHESQKSISGGVVMASFDVYFPFDINDGVVVKRGMTFKGDAYGLTVNGRVISVFPSSLGGVQCRVEDLDV